MQSEDNEQFADVQRYEDFHDQKSYRVWRPHKSCKLSNIMKREPHFTNFRKVRKPTYVKYRSRLKSVPYYDHPMPFTCKAKLTFPDSENAAPSYTKTVFKKREITTIPEEVFHYKRHSKSLSTFKSVKAYKEKVASLKVVVGRLKEMCLAKPEVLQNKLPEEIMKLFAGIKI